MFASSELLRKKTPAIGIGRKEYIERLVEEFHASTNIESKEQITANLANFAYDPINYKFLRESAALGVFLQLLTLPNDRLILHGIAGISNICLDPKSREEITNSENIKFILEVIQSTQNTEILIHLLTLLYLLLSEDQGLKHQICTSRNLQKIRCYKNSFEDRLKILAVVFLEDFAVRTVDIENNA